MIPHPSTGDGDAMEGVMLAMLSHAATVDRATVARAVGAACSYLRALEPVVMLYGDDATPEGAVDDAVNAACLALHDATRGTGREPLDGDTLARALVTLVCNGMGAELGAVIAEQAMPGELSDDATRLEKLGALVTGQGGVA